MKKECGCFLIAILFLSNGLRAADRDETSVGLSGSVLPTSPEIAKKILIFFGPPHAGQKELYKSVRYLLEQYGKRTFLVSEDLFEQRKAVLNRSGASSGTLKVTEKPLLLPMKTTGDMFLEDSPQMPHGYDVSKYIKNMNFLMDVRNRLNNPDNKTCFYAMFFWAKDKIVGRRFRDFLDDYPGQYFLIKVMSDYQKATTRLVAHALKASKTTAIDVTELSLQKMELLQEYKGQCKKITAFEDSLFNICVNTTHLSDPVKDVKNVQPVTSPRTGPIDILDPLSPRKLERAISTGLKEKKNSGYDDEAAKIVFFLNLKTDMQELQKRIE